MEPKIRFCTTSDGVRIAYMTVGEGRTVVRVLGWFTHLEFMWNSNGPAIEQNAVMTGSKFVLYDGRGMGLSDRDIDDFSLEGQVRDIEAVVDAVGDPRISFSAVSQGGPTVISYTARHPERVQGLTFYCSFAKLPWPPEFTQSLVSLARHGWGQDTPAFRQMFTGLFIPDGSAEDIAFFTEAQRVSATPEAAAKMIEAIPQTDVRHLLPEIDVPVLVIHRRGDAVVPLEAGRELAAGIADSRFVVLEGRNHAPTANDPELPRLLEAIVSFGAELDAREGVTYRDQAPGGFVTVLFTDIEASTPMTRQLGDARAQEIVRAHNAVVDDALTHHKGRRVKHTGDGVMASFSSSSDAVACAVAIQRALHAYNVEHAELPIRVRMGLNAGEPIAEDDDLFGTAVIVASRIADQAGAGDILVSDVVRQLVAGKGFAFEDRGQCVLKGFEEATHVHAVQWIADA